MTKLPRISGRDCVSALLKLGFQIKRQHGSHIILSNGPAMGRSNQVSNKGLVSYSVSIW
jgi:predicted RNA binding protein YcfA (HicA-like mRNA interferase family)